MSSGSVRFFEAPSEVIQGDVKLNVLRDLGIQIQQVEVVVVGVVGVARPGGEGCFSYPLPPDDAQEVAIIIYRY